MKQYKQTVIAQQAIGEIVVGYKNKGVKVTEQPKIMTSRDSAEFLRKMWNDDSSIEYVEQFMIICTNYANRIIGWAKISLGGISGTVCDPKVIFQVALGCNASKIILAHNHPSGNLQPSPQDKQLTSRLYQGAKLLDMEILDHVILTSDNYYSFADEGALY